SRLLVFEGLCSRRFWLSFPRTDPRGKMGRGSARLRFGSRSFQSHRPNRSYSVLAKGRPGPGARHSFRYADRRVLRRNGRPLIARKIGMYRAAAVGSRRRVAICLALLQGPGWPCDVSVAGIRSRVALKLEPRWTDFNSVAVHGSEESQE